jgi:valyl-tRNA synthetase
MTTELPKAYEPREIEERWARAWVEQALFRADPEQPGLVFSIVIPPPNVTGSLHIGHMLNHTEIDILTRWHRMRGFNTLYLPGTDHAGIGTQVVVERQLAAEGLTRQKIGRAAFEKRIWKWKQESGGTIKEQMMQLGESCDWSRERFTLDPGLANAVREVFVRLYEEGLIYRGHYMVNWCPRCQTAISDLETVHIERTGKLWHMRYPFSDGDGYIVVATTRPETMLGDMAVAVHPNDERYQRFIGRSVRLPLTGREIPVIADEYVDPAFGTGAVKITPAHDSNDFEVGKRHNLRELNVMTEDAHMNDTAGAYAGLDRFGARKKILADLESQGLLEKVEDHALTVGVCDRCKTDIEPRASTQWFVRMKPLAEPAIAAVESGEISIVPEFHKATYFEWMRNIRDWCISRQLWWGHRVPAWYCHECGEIVVSRGTPTECPRGHVGALEQDPDVLDTWFSSSLWPFSTMGWPEETPDFLRYYPTSLLLTAHDILFFWVARMIMMGLKFTGHAPFPQVYLHSLVRTTEGAKMSKSKGTGIDPLTINAKYGTDAIRFTLASMAAPGTDIVLSDDRMQSGRAFANKIWNAMRFVFFNLEKVEASGLALEALASPEARAGAPYAIEGKLALEDAWIFSRLATVVAQINDALENYRFHEAANVIYHFFWGEICDWYIEWIKPRLSDANVARATIAWKNLFAVLEAALRLLHPFMPFLTEELWHKLPQPSDARSIALDHFPEAHPSWANPTAESRMALLREIIGDARNIRAELKSAPKERLTGELSITDPEAVEFIRENWERIEQLANLSASLVSTPSDAAFAAVKTTPRYDMRISYSISADAVLVTADEERARLSKEIDRLSKDVESKRARLADEQFRSRAPAAIVETMEAALAHRQAELEKLSARLSEIGNR